jgi:hypothetical protein
MSIHGYGIQKNAVLQVNSEVSALFRTAPASRT